MCVCVILPYVYVIAFVPIESGFSTISEPTIVPIPGLWLASTASRPRRRGLRTAAGRGLLLLGHGSHV